MATAPPMATARPQTIARPPWPHHRARCRPGRAHGGRRRRHPRRRRRVDAPGPSARVEAEEARRVVGVIRAIRARLPDVPISIDTSKPAVARGRPDGRRRHPQRRCRGDLCGGAGGRSRPRIGAPLHPHARSAPSPGTGTSSARSSTTCAARVERAVAAGCRTRRAHRRSGHRLRQDRRAEPRAAARPGRAPRARPADARWAPAASRPSGGCSGCPVEERLEGTLATTALGGRGGRRHRARPRRAANVRVARMSDAIVRGGWHDRTRCRGTNRTRYGARSDARRAADGGSCGWIGSPCAGCASRAASGRRTRSERLPAARRGRPRGRGRPGGGQRAPTPWPTPSTTGHSSALVGRTVEGGSFRLLEGLAGRHRPRGARRRPAHRCGHRPRAQAGRAARRGHGPRRGGGSAGSARSAEARPPRLTTRSWLDSACPARARYWLAGLVPSSICRSRTSSPRSTRRVTVSRGPVLREDHRRAGCHRRP